MLNGIENVKIIKTVSEKVVYEGLLWSLMFLKVKFFYLCFNYFIVKKNVLESTDGAYSQLTHTVQRWGRERAGGSRVGRWE